MSNLLGHRVRIDGLKGRPEFNGRCGVAARFDEAKGRYEVTMEGDEALALLLKQANLQDEGKADADEAKQWKIWEDDGVVQQRQHKTAELQARLAEHLGDNYSKLVADGARYASKHDWRNAVRTYREAIALRPDDPVNYLNLGAVLSNSGHPVEAVPLCLEAMERFPVGSEPWGRATASAYMELGQEQCDRMAKPEWWNEEGLKALSARVVRAAPNNVPANQMRAAVLANPGGGGAWQTTGRRSGAELSEGATYYRRAAALSPAPAMKAAFARKAEDIDKMLRRGPDGFTSVTRAMPASKA